MIRIIDSRTLLLFCLACPLVLGMDGLASAQSSLPKRVQSTPSASARPVPALDGLNASSDTGQNSLDRFSAGQPSTAGSATFPGGSVTLGAGGTQQGCYATDDGTCNAASGWIDSITGQLISVPMLWMKGFEAIGGSDTIVEISTMYGFPGGSVSNGVPVRLGVWDDPTNDYDPTDAVLLWEGTTTSVNENLNIFSPTAVPSIPVTGVFFVGVSVTSSFNYWGPLDFSSISFGRSWHVAHFGANSVNFNTIANNDEVFVQNGAWMLRARGTGLCDAGVDPVCYGVDDANSENAFGLTAGGESAWLMGFDAQGGTDTITEISTTYGNSALGGTLSPGQTGRLAIWDDPTDDYDPTDAVLLWQAPTVSANENTNIFNTTAVPNIVVNGVFYLGATLDHGPGEFPGPIDNSAPLFSGRSFFVGSTLGPGTLDLNNLLANDVGLYGTGTIGDFMLRANGCDGVSLDCYGFGDSTAENAYGLTAGGEAAWFMAFNAVAGSDTITEISTAYGAPGIALGSGLNGRLAIWDDPTNDYDPDDAVLLWEATTVSANEGTSILNATPVPDIEVSGIFYVGATLDHAPGEFPIPVDTTIPYSSGRMYLMGSTLGPGTVDLNDLSVNDVAPFPAGTVGELLVRANGRACGDCNGNGINDIEDIANGTSADCDGNGLPDECDLDCNENGTPDACDIAGGTSLDCNGNGIPDECEPDCNGSGLPDDCDVMAGTSEDCNGNGIPDECDLAAATSEDCNGNLIPDECDLDCNENGTPDDCDLLAGTSMDCNSNAIPDECDLAAATSEDCNGNLVPDECDLDCNENGTPDDCDLLAGTSLDCNGNSIPDECDLAAATSEDCNANAIPDECEADCNSNGVPDDCDLTAGTSADCNGNSIPDECDVATASSEDCNGNGLPDECELDCNSNGVPDDCDLTAGTSQDCNGNSIPDECDVAAATSEDCNGNDIPDECELDCNQNGVPDDCDIAAGTSDDRDGNSIPDECDGTQHTPVSPPLPPTVWPPVPSGSSLLWDQERRAAARETLGPWFGLVEVVEEALSGWLQFFGQAEAR